MNWSIALFFSVVFTCVSLPALMSCWKDTGEENIVRQMKKLWINAWILGLLFAVYYAVSTIIGAIQMSLSIQRPVGEDIAGACFLAFMPLGAMIVLPFVAKFVFVQKRR